MLVIYTVVSRCTDSRTSKKIYNCKLVCACSYRCWLKSCTKIDRETNKKKKEREEDRNKEMKAERKLVLLSRSNHSCSYSEALPLYPVSHVSLIHPTFITAVYQRH